MASPAIDVSVKTISSLQRLLVEFNLLSPQNVGKGLNVETKRAIKQLQSIADMPIDETAIQATLDFLRRHTMLPTPPEQITHNQLSYILGRQVSESLTQDLNRSLQIFKILGSHRQAHFISQVAHESDGMREFSFFLDYLESRSNYATLSKAVRDDRAVDRDYASTYYPLSCAAFWWADRGLNHYTVGVVTAREMSRRASGGWVGLTSRTRYYNSAVDVIIG
jgi:predicted chitinase